MTSAVPLSRMFPEGRPDIFGEDWRDKWYPFLPDSQIRQPESFRIPQDQMWFDR